ncbi:MAG: hypothetical protein HQK99_06075 [Nitrospirae bacterium]|nr:hypothetical protein [Nitrospirota bacterium]
MPEGKLIINLQNRLAVLLTISGVLLFAAADVAAVCEDTYYYASFNDARYYPTQRIRAFDLSVLDAYIYDLPKLPSSWVYIFDKDDLCITGVTAAAKSDKYAISFKDLKKFIILSQPKDLSGKEPYISFSLAYMKKEGGTGTKVALLERFIDVYDFKIVKIDKCILKKQRLH